MKRLLIGLFLISNFGFTQVVPDTSKMTMTEKMMWYNNEKKSAARGIFYSFLIPTTGHAYAGNWKRGLIIKGAQVTLIIIQVLVYEEAYGKWDDDHYQSNKEVSRQLCLEQGAFFVFVYPKYKKKTFQ